MKNTKNKTQESEDIMRAKNLWLNSVYENVSQLIDFLINYAQGQGSFDDMTNKIQESIYQIYDLPEGVEVFEWYSVNDWMYEKLKENGEVVFQFKGLNLWGRITTGQAVYIDRVILDIYDDWKKSIDR